MLFASEIPSRKAEQRDHSRWQHGQQHRGTCLTGGAGGIRRHAHEETVGALVVAGFLDGFVAGIHSDPEILVSINDIGNIDQMTLIDIPEKTIEAEEIGEEY